MKNWLLAICCLSVLSGCDSRTPEQIGKDLANEKIDLVKGVSEVVKDKGEGVADSVAQGVGNIVSGLRAGFDESLIKVDVRIAESLAENELLVTRAQHMEPNGKDSADGVTAYLSSADGFEGKLILIAIAKDGEIGRSIEEIKIEKGSAAYFDFEFDQRTPLGSAEYFEIDRVKI